MIPHKAIRPVGTIHLTLGVMSLTTEERLQAAINLLKSMDVVGLLPEPRIFSIQPNPSGDLNKPFVTSATASDRGEDHEYAATVEPSTSSPHVQPIGLVQTLSRSITPPQPLKNTRPQSINAAPELPIIVSLKSLHAMQSPTKTSILYAEPEPTSTLLHLGDQFRTLFQRSGYLVLDDRPLKLHATIVNTIYAKSGGRHGRVRATPRRDADEEQEQDGSVAPPSTPNVNASKAPLRFDARPLIAQFEGFVWASDIRIEKVAICKMGAIKVVGADGEVAGEEYEEVASVALA